MKIHLTRDIIVIGEEEFHTRIQKTIESLIIPKEGDKVVIYQNSLGYLEVIKVVIDYGENCYYVKLRPGFVEKEVIDNIPKMLSNYFKDGWKKI